MSRDTLSQERDTTRLRLLLLLLVFLFVRVRTDVTPVVETVRGPFVPSSVGRVESVPDTSHPSAGSPCIKMGSEGEVVVVSRGTGIWNTKSRVEIPSPEFR